MSIRKIKKTNSFQVRYRDHQGIQRAKTFTLKKDAENSIICFVNNIKFYMMIFKKTSKLQT